MFKFSRKLEKLNLLLIVQNKRRKRKSKERGRYNCRWEARSNLGENCLRSGVILYWRVSGRYYGRFGRSQLNHCQRRLGKVFSQYNKAFAFGVRWQRLVLFEGTIKWSHFTIDVEHVRRVLTTFIRPGATLNHLSNQTDCRWIVLSGRFLVHKHITLRFESLFVQPVEVANVRSPRSCSLHPYPWQKWAISSQHSSAPQSSQVLKLNEFWINFYNAPL